MLRNLVIIISILFLVSCQPKQNIVSRPQNAILYVSYPKAEVGSIRSDLSEIFVYDIDKKIKFQITKDRHSDGHPTWEFNTNKIIFESKRPASGMFAENNPSHLFSADIMTGEIEQYDIHFYENYPNVIGEENIKPAFSYLENKIAFATKVVVDSGKIGDVVIPKYRYKSVCIDLDYSTILNLGYIKKPTRLLWSPSGKYLAYNCFFSMSKLPIRNEIVVINLEDQSTINYGNVDVDPSLLCWGVMDDEIIISELNIITRKQNIYTLNINSNDKNPINFNNGEECFFTKSGDLIILKGSVEDRHASDFYLQIKNQSQEIQLTSDKKVKHDVVIY